MQELIKAWTLTRKQIIELTVVKQWEHSEGVFHGGVQTEAGLRGDV